MCRRANPPAQGQWSLPSGFLECGETLEEAAARETLEETGIAVEPANLELYAVSNITEIDQVAVTFRVEVGAKPGVRVGPECLEVAFLSEGQLGQKQVAWRESYGNESERFFGELRSGRFTIQLATLGSKGGGDFRAREYRLASASAYRRAGKG